MINLITAADPPVITNQTSIYILGIIFTAVGSGATALFNAWRSSKTDIQAETIKGFRDLMGEQQKLHASQIKAMQDETAANREQFEDRLQEVEAKVVKLEAAKVSNEAEILRLNDCLDIERRKVATCETELLRAGIPIPVYPEVVQRRARLGPILPNTQE